MKWSGTSLILLNVLTLLVFVVTVILTFFAELGGSDIFLDTTNNVSNLNNNVFRKARWSIYVFAFIFALQILWLIFSLTLICRKGPEGPLYLHPVLFTPAFFWVHILGDLLYIGWLFLLDRQALELAFVFLLGSELCYYACLVLSYRTRFEHKLELQKQGRHVDNVLFILFVENAIGAFAIWILGNALFTLAMVMTSLSSTPLGPVAGGCVSLGFLIVLLTTLDIVDIFVVRKFSEYTFSTYIAKLIIIVSVVDANIGRTNLNTILTLIPLGMEISFFLVKIIIVAMDKIKHSVVPNTETELLM
ncbi:uncharacterized protein LOC124126499 [Haliotis rufescens]|uniref:uncharacterized protein LOC124126498 n=1 Tax=Haliotis rufescens TaxID=6454 RepID=UPI00201F498D|nr:uncharacterized protein LOC124126498 [Haliotis rufescens]XP_046345898.2 uncharacterized protein LOC124126498 [Haliotis rufescens]XP_046345899.2 uncharacterized protein LOC124126499 [Haliotis rufescens]XP_046345900.2 uncharacterized protein LOC124126499 [Haliotis rufescens]